MPVNYAALKTELQTDPASLGYSSFVAIRNDVALASILIFVRDGSTVCPVNGVAGASITVRRSNVKPDEILEAIDIRDFPVSPTGVNSIPLAQSWLESITQFSTVRLANTDGTKTTVRKNIDRLVDNVQGSQTRLDTVAERRGSRSEQLFGENVAVTSTDVAIALNN